MSPVPVNDKNSKIFYGYFVVGASVIIMMVAWGANRAFGVFLEPMLKEFGWTRAAISDSFTLNMLVMGGAALAAGIAIPGRILMGAVGDRIGNRPALLICLSMSIVAFSILLLAKNLGLLYLFAVLYGLGLWATASLLSPLVAELFGLRSHATLYSWTVFTSCIGSAAGPVLAGALFDSRGNYHLAFFLCLVFSVIGLVATLLIRPIHAK